MADVSSAVDAIFDAATTQHSVFYDLYDAEMRSPCQVGKPFVHDQFDVVAWRPQRREHASDFSGLENALETEIHRDVKAYYGRYWSGCIETEHEEGHVSLIFLWNHKDIDRLIENLIGHSLAQKRSRSPLSIFFACTEPDSELFLAVNNSTGEIQLEKPGYRPVRTVAEDLSTFLSALTPASPWQHPSRTALKELY